MKAWVVRRPGPADAGPLQLVDRPLREPGPGQLRVRVRCCGVCRTDLHLAEGDLVPRRADVTPGHEVVGMVDALGLGAGRFALGERVGVAWLGGTDGRCRFCPRGEENLCLQPTFTGWDVDGGYAEACLVAAEYAYRLLDGLPDEQAAPLLCAGITGYRALRAAAVRPGGSLGIYGFGVSAHLTAQLALRQGLRVHVLTRGEGNRELADALGVDSVGPADGRPPELLDGAILFAPAGELVPVAMPAPDREGTLAVAGIWLSQIPALHYDAELFQERTLRSVTAKHPHRRRAVPDPRRPAWLAGNHRAEADRALADLAAGRYSGAAVPTSRTDAGDRRRRGEETDDMTRTTGRLSRPLASAGVLLSAAGVVILLGIITAEALYPAAYSTFDNEISDLGATRPPDSVSYQPSAAIFDGTMALSGALILLAAVLVYRRTRRRTGPLWLGIFGASVLLVGVFPGNTAPHPLVATATFLSAGVVALVVSRTQPAPARYVSAVLGTVTLVSMALGFFLHDWGPVAELGDGGIERWIAYPAVLWLAVYGGYLMAAREPVPQPASTSRAAVPAVG